MYLHPQGVSNDLIDHMVSSEVVTSYFDLSLQHTSKRVLRGMGRWGGRARFEAMIDRIRAIGSARRDPLDLHPWVPRRNRRGCCRGGIVRCRDRPRLGRNVHLFA